MAQSSLDAPGSGEAVHAYQNICTQSHMVNSPKAQLQDFHYGDYIPHPTALSSWN